MHPALRRCSSLEYSRYSRSSRLARRAPRPSRCDTAPSTRAPDHDTDADMPLPAWATKMRDLFRSGSVAQFLLHGNVFDVIPHGDRQLSLKAFLDEAMFGAYDSVLQYDRSRGVRATRGADDWGAWLQQALGDANPISSTREPGVALELIDRYLLRTLNLGAIQKAGDPAASGVRKIAVV